MNNYDAVLQALSAIRIPARPEEYDIHAEISHALREADIQFEHEYRIAPRARIDFLVANIGIEVKKGRPLRSALIVQLGRYLQSDQIAQVIVVTQSNLNLPGTLNGKRITLFTLEKLWGVALP